MQLRYISMFVLFGAHYRPEWAPWAFIPGPQPTNGPEERAQNPAHLVGWVGLGYGLCGLLRGLRAGERISLGIPYVGIICLFQSHPFIRS